MPTEDSQKNDLRFNFEKFSAAKIIVEGVVVQNLTLSP